MNPRNPKPVKPSRKQIAEANEPAVFPKAYHSLRANPAESARNSKPQKRDNIFSQSRDTHEDRGTRQMKNTGNAQTFHGR